MTPRLVIRRGPKTFRPFGTGARGTVAAIVATFALVSILSAGLSIWTTTHSRNRAAVLEVAARQRTLAERYVADVLLVHGGESADPATVASILQRSAQALLDGGTAPAVDGDDDETRLRRQDGPAVRAQLLQEERLVADLATSGSAYLAGEELLTAPLTAGEHLDTTSPVQRIRILAALTSNVSLNAARTIAAKDDRGISDLILLQIALGTVGLACSLLMAWALVVATRRQTAHFRSLVTASTDLVLVLDESGCRHASVSVTTMLARPESDLLGDGIFGFVHEDDRAALQKLRDDGGSSELVFRLVNADSEWRHLEARQTDLRADRHIRGVVLNARDITDRVALEQELTRQAATDALTGLMNRRTLEMHLSTLIGQGARFAIAIADLDHFKRLNDTHGHEAGDRSLRLFAQELQRSLRDADLIARWGGEEFVIVLPGLDRQQGANAFERVRAGLAAAHAGENPCFTASFGVTDSTAGDTMEELLALADASLYLAKEAGRDRVVRGVPATDAAHIASLAARRRASAA